MMSTKVCPYVYKGIHKTTGHFYIGVRFSSKIKLIPELDIYNYQTSSRRVKDIGFSNFDWQIIAMFFTESAAVDATSLEREMILENKENKLMLNSVVTSEKHIISIISSKGKQSSRLGCKNKNKLSYEARQKYRDNMKGNQRRKGQKNSKEHNRKIGEANSRSVTCYDLISNKFLSIPKEVFSDQKQLGRYVGAKSSKIPR